MGKFPPHYSDSDDDTSSSMENGKKKKKLSLFKYATGNFKKKKPQTCSKSEASQSDFSSRSRSYSNHRLPSSNNSTRKLVGILKHTTRVSSDDDEDMLPQPMFRSQDRCLVGQVPRPPGTKPGRGGGLAILVRKNVSNLQPQQGSTSNTCTKRLRKPTKSLSRKRSY